jgi:hypothetical protein
MQVDHLTAIAHLSGRERARIAAARPGGGQMEVSVSVT